MTEKEFRTGMDRAQRKKVEAKNFLGTVDASIARYRRSIEALERRRGEMEEQLKAADGRIAYLRRKRAETKGHEDLKLRKHRLEKEIRVLKEHRRRIDDPVI
jgi:cell division septum initiation protein DivIVA